MQDFLGPLGLAAAQLAAQLADDDRPVVVDELTDERRPAAVRACVAARLQPHDSPLQEPQFEVGREQRGERACHGRLFDS
jgi:hypothetical protein